MNHPLVGKYYAFEDGNRIEVIQVKDRGEEILLVTYMISYGAGIPRKLVMPMSEFMGTYRHLFPGIEE
ncbi:MAG: hypothetical protein ACOVLB_03795 [Candidatus Nanopelagicus sp.]